ncbi:hypothetical protein BDY17DRAFT_301092 [Neohortaea acidophila]|uniref:Uncharacterized protein n=1 Tax=Neohortaea acidophila TaxID=245834 RepID=A0A6A6PMN3_9PEZI|nr:uncharacterized protein BDY17DRAFT_301092 [Neohortaea acidophila]KAF2481319.1 hypothetical protein BDY17DRAFT_301092 [Neohortaea acidophila]
MSSSSTLGSVHDSVHRAPRSRHVTSIPPCQGYYCYSVSYDPRLQDQTLMLAVGSQTSMHFQTIELLVVRIFPFAPLLLPRSRNFPRTLGTVCKSRHPDTTVRTYVYSGSVAIQDLGPLLATPTPRQSAAFLPRGRTSAPHIDYFSRKSHSAGRVKRKGLV